MTDSGASAARVGLVHVDATGCVFFDFRSEFHFSIGTLGKWRVVYRGVES
jgi:hypothetical protein